MVYVNKLLLLNLFFISLAWASAPVQELATKQPIRSIRYISEDGSLTYFQNSRGKLFLSSNYNLYTLMTKAPHTQYTLYSSPEKRYMIIEVQENFFKRAIFQADNELYQIKYGQHKTNFLGKGQAPRFHEQGKWVSFYRASHHDIKLVNLDAPLIFKKIKIRNRVFPYFIPEVILYNDKNILYTDISPKGHEGIIFYNRETNKKQLIYASKKLGEHFQLCQNENAIFIFSSGQTTLKASSVLWRLPKNKPVKAENFQELYSSSFNDIGNPICNFDKKNIYFVKTKAPTKYTLAKNIVIQLNIASKKLTTIYNNESSFTLYRLNHKLMVTAQGKQFVIRGNTLLKDDSIK